MKVFTPFDAKTSNKNMNKVPDFVIQTINELLTENWNDKEIILKRDIIIERMQYHTFNKYSISVLERFISSFHWFNFKSLYEDAGWDVSFETVSFSNRYPYFKFTVKK